MFKWGIIGTGGIAKAFANDLQYLEGHQVKAVASRTKENATNFSLKYNKCIAYDNYEAFVQDPSLDGIYVATPNHLHLEHTLLALNAGKPVLCEKPFAMNSYEVQLMVDTARRKNVLLVEAMWARFLPHMIHVKKIVESGILGNILSLQADHGQKLTHIKNPRLWNLEYGGGALLDLGIYIVSFAHLILGKPEKIMASSTFNAKNIDTQTSAIFDYGNGTQAILNCTLSNTTPCRSVISGDQGYLEIDPIFYAPSSFKVTLNNGEVLEYLKDYSGHGLREQALEFSRCIKKGLKETPLLRHIESLQVMNSMDQIRKKVNLKFPSEKNIGLNII